MSRPDNLLYPKSTDGWETSVADKELVTELFPQDFTKPGFRTISLKVKEECKVKLVLGEQMAEEILHILPETGLEIDSRFHRVYSFKFITEGTSYYALYSY